MDAYDYKPFHTKTLKLVNSFGDLVTFLPGGSLSGKIKVMKIIDSIRFDDNIRMAFVGAGGKTTAIFRLARQMAGRVLVTTSTHLGVGQVELADNHYVIQSGEDLATLKEGLGNGVTLVTGPGGKDRRVTGLSLELLAALNDIAHSHEVPLLIEADGCRRRPLKAPAEHEPAIPDFVNTVVVVAGISGLGKPLNEKWVHRPERFGQLSGLEMGKKIASQDVVKVLRHPSGGMKNIPDGARKVVLLNQVDTPEQAGLAKGIAKALLREYESVVVASLLKLEDEVSAVHTNVAGVVLAGGESQRIGRPKQLLEWRGQPFISIVTEIALRAGLNPVVVVTGAYLEEVKGALGDMAVDVVYNPEWKKGQSTSVKTGLAALPEGTGAVVFLLVDQPKIPVNLVEMLVETHARTMSPVVAPMIGGSRGNPVLFDRITFPDFSDIEGDAGGRQLFSKYEPIWVPWVDDSVNLDVDTLEDYKRLVG